MNEEQKQQVLKADIKVEPKISKAQREKAYKNQIKLLNDVVTVKIAPSNIHGVGLFAIRDFKKGEKLYTDIVPHQIDLPYKWFSFIKKEVREILLGQFPLILEGSHFWYPAGKLSAYLNHSNTPNYDAKKDETLKDIKAGDEITEDYRVITTKYKKLFPWLD